MSEYIMNRESLKRHCEAMCHKFKDIPTSGAYGEHRLVLELLKQTTWIPVSERLPEENETVIAATKHDVYPKARYTKEYGWECIYEPGADYWVELADVTEWMKRNELTLDDSIWSMWPPLSVRARNVLLRAGFRTIGDVLKCSRADLMRVRNMGRKSFEEVEERFSKYGKFNGEG